MAILWTGTVATFCLIRLDAAPKVSIPNFDKFVHAVFHFGFTMLWYLYFRLQFKQKNKYWPLVIAFLMSVSFGVMIEIVQQYGTLYRSGDVLDVLANTFGATIAVCVFYMLDKYNYLQKIH